KLMVTPAMAGQNKLSLTFETPDDEVVHEVVFRVSPEGESAAIAEFVANPAGGAYVLDAQLGLRGAWQILALVTFHDGDQLRFEFSATVAWARPATAQATDPVVGGPVHAGALPESGRRFPKLRTGPALPQAVRWWGSIGAVARHGRFPVALRSTPMPGATDDGHDVPAGPMGTHAPQPAPEP